MYRSLFVPLDGSPFSAYALPVAIALARRTGATIHLVHVSDPSAHVPLVTAETALPRFDEAAVSDARRRDQARLDAHVTSLIADGIPAVGHVLEGTVVEALAEGAVQLSADLVIMTTHGRSGVSRLRLGSVASAFLTRAVAPVYLVRGTERAPTTAPDQALLCALDGSAFSERILPHAVQLASALQSPLRLMAVAIPHAVPMSPFGTDLLADRVALDDEEMRLHNYMGSVVSQCPAGTTTTVLTDMSVVSTILDEADRCQAGGIALSTHGRSGLNRLLLGSVADELIRRSALPLLVFHPTAEAK